MYDRDDEALWAKEIRDEVILRHMVRVNVEENNMLLFMYMLSTGLEVDWQDDIGECSTAGRADACFATTRKK